MAYGRKRKDDDFIDDSELDGASRRKKTFKDTRKDDEDGDDGITACELSRTRKVRVRQFKNMVFVDIREFFENKEGDLRPSKKGIALSLEQWEMLRDHIKDVDEAIGELK